MSSTPAEDPCGSCPFRNKKILSKYFKEEGKIAMTKIIDDDRTNFTYILLALAVRLVEEKLPQSLARDRLASIIVEKCEDILSLTPPPNHCQKNSHIGGKYKCFREEKFDRLWVLIGDVLPWTRGNADILTKLLNNLGYREVGNN